MNNYIPAEILLLLIGLFLVFAAYLIGANIPRIINYIKKKKE